MNKRFETWNLPVRRLDIVPHLKISNYKGPIQISIGIPAYKREDKLIRCLDSVARQKSRPFKVIVSNDDPNSEIHKILFQKYSQCFAGLEVYQQPTNLGSLANFNFLLQKADTEYFMWLANDDEISDNWIEDLAMMLDEDRSAVGAMGLWVFGNSVDAMCLHAQIKHDDKNRVLRLLKFVWNADDALFYGLFRRKMLLSGNFPGFFWPNNGFIRNWCYVFLIGPISLGHMIYSDSCYWFNHDYGEKHYPGAPAAKVKIFNLVAGALRRINVYLLYIANFIRSEFALSFLLAITSLIALLREAVQFLMSIFSRAAKTCVKNLSSE